MQRTKKQIGPELLVNGNQTPFFHKLRTCDTYVCVLGSLIRRAFAQRFMTDESTGMRGSNIE